MYEGFGDSEHARLLASVAEQLKVPLMSIARQAELHELTDGPDKISMTGIRTQADAALVLVDSYLLGLRLLHGQPTLDLEPVSVPALLVEAAHELDRFARQYDVQLELQIAGRYVPVMAHRVGLKAALISLGYSIIEAQSTSDVRRVTLSAHRTSKGIITGLYGTRDSLGVADWRKALALCGQASQPFTDLSASSAAGLFVAHTLLQAMESSLRVGKRLTQYGFAMTLQPSQQLQFV